MGDSKLRGRRRDKIERTSARERARESAREVSGRTRDGDGEGSGLAARARCDARDEPRR